MKAKLIIAALILCAVLCACGESEESSREYYQIVTDAPTEPEETEPNSAQGYVKSAKKESFRVEEAAGGWETNEFQIPKLTMDSKDAKAINSEIEKTYENDFKDAAKAVDEGKTPKVTEISYESYLTEDVLSVVITRTYSSHTVDYGVYNYHIIKNTRLDNKGIAAYMGRDESELNAAVEESLQNDYVSKFKYDNFKDDYYINYEKTLSDDNINKSMLFFDNSGSLCAICKEYATVGAGEFNVKIKVELSEQND